MRSPAEFEEAAEAGFMPVIAEARGDFRMRSVIHDLGDLTLTDSHNPPLRMVRTQRMANAGRDALLFFSLGLAGSRRLRHTGQETSLRPGVGTLLDTHSPWDLDAAAATRTMILEFPRSNLGLPDAAIRHEMAQGFDPTMPAMQLLSGYIRQLGEASAGLTAVQRHDAGLVAIDLIAMTLRGNEATVPEEESADAILVAMMRRHIRERLTDPELSVASLARHHHISVRRTHAAFSRIGTAPGAYIREQRLQAAKAFLADPRFIRRSVADIGADVGIYELRTFQRAFVRRFGLTPSQWRHDSTASPQILPSE
jgi:AraC-like DNA-binding protein